MTNPFMARKKPGTGEPATVAGGRAAEDAPSAGNAADTPPRTDSQPSRAELREMSKPQLVALARTRNLDADGTKAELVERLAP